MAESHTGANRPEPGDQMQFSAVAVVSVVFGYAFLPRMGRQPDSYRHSSGNRCAWSAGGLIRLLISAINFAVWHMRGGFCEIAGNKYEKYSAIVRNRK